MNAPIYDLPEFTDEQLRAALRDVGEEARRAAFAAGRPVMVAREGWLVLLRPDGSEEVVSRIPPSDLRNVASLSSGRP